MSGNSYLDKLNDSSVKTTVGPPTRKRSAPGNFYVGAAEGQRSAAWIPGANEGLQRLRNLPQTISDIPVQREYHIRKEALRRQMRRALGDRKNDYSRPWSSWVYYDPDNDPGWPGWRRVIEFSGGVWTRHRSMKTRQWMPWILNPCPDCFCGTCTQ